jgi:acetyltransferase-like isoleucine patch superfamily enzyme
MLLRSMSWVRERVHRLWAHANLASRLDHPLPASVVVLGKPAVYGTGNISFGKNVLLYPNLYLETQSQGSIDIGDGVVISTGCHIVSRASIVIGKGTMIGEFTSIRDSNHSRTLGKSLRESEDVSAPIIIGNEVWIGRGVAILQGVTIGDYATVGANAVVTRNVPGGTVVAGVPARPMVSSESSAESVPVLPGASR